MFPASFYDLLLLLNMALRTVQSTASRAEMEKFVAICALGLVFFPPMVSWVIYLVARQKKMGIVFASVELGGD